MINLPPRKILLNPGPVTTTDTVKQALVVADICHRENEFKNLIKSICFDLLRVVQAKQDYTSVLFAASGTGALEACLSSVMDENKKIAIINNGAYGQRLVNIANRYKLNVVELKFPFDEPLPLADIEAILSQDANITHLAVVHHETSLGTLNPIRELGALCKQAQKSMIVDAMSSFAGVPINVYQDNIDYLISSANKCLHGMPGLSFVICKKSQLAQTKGKARSYYFDLYQQYQGLETRGEMPFTPPVQLAYALAQALQEYFAKGEEAHIAQYHQRYDQLVSGLTALGFTVVTPEANQSKLLLTVKFPQEGKNYDFDELHDYLYARGYTIYPKKLAIANTFRLACLGDLTKQDIANFLLELELYLKEAQKQLALHSKE